MKKAICLILAVLAAGISAEAQRVCENMPSCGLKPDKTVFLYSDNIEASLAAINDPVVADNPETLALEIAEDNGYDEPEFLYGPEGQIRSIGREARFDVYFPENPNGKMVVVCPGGGYYCLATYHEGMYVAEWLLKRGYAAVVAKHRLPNTHHAVPLTDMHIIFRYLREHQQEWGLEKIGVMGFSAGGHMAGCVSTLYVDAATRPDFSVLIYPVLTFGEYTHEGTRMTLLGRESVCKSRVDVPFDEWLENCREYDALSARYTLEDQVTADTPPAFLMLAFDDDVVPPANSINYYRALLAHGVSAELHIFENGGHGFGFASEQEGQNWLDAGEREVFEAALERWLESR